MSETRKYYYLKLKENFFNRKDIILLENMQDGVFYSNILLKLYLISLEFDGHLRLNEDVFFTSSMLASIIRCEIGTVERALKVFLQLGLAAELPDGSLYMTEIEGMVGKSSTEADRKRLARQKIKALQSGVTDVCPTIVGYISENSPPEINKENKPDTDSKKEKDVYGRFDNVFLSTQEYEHLNISFPKYAKIYIDKLSTYMESKGRLYKNHYATLLDWLNKDFPETDYCCEDGENL